MVFLFSVNCERALLFSVKCDLDPPLPPSRERGLKQRKVLEVIESLRQKHRGMRVLNNFDHVETWKPVLNSFFDREKDCSRQ